MGRGEGKEEQATFNVKMFLSTINGERSLSDYRKNQKVFSQGDAADAVFYVQEGKSKSASSPTEEKRPSSRSMEGRLLRRRLPDRATAPLSHSRGDDGLRDHADRQGCHRARAA